jgi:hypothetical protein
VHREDGAFDAGDLATAAAQRHIGITGWDIRRRMSMSPATFLHLEEMVGLEITELRVPRTSTAC